MASTLICEGDAPCKPCICGAPITQMPGPGRLRETCSTACRQIKGTIETRSTRCCRTCRKPIPVTADLRVKYCNAKCYPKQLRTSHPGVCVVCGSAFVSESRGKKSCSEACFVAMQKASAAHLVKSYECPTCGVIFPHRRTGNRYCSKACIPKAHGIQVEKRGAKWHVRVRDEDGYNPTVFRSTSESEARWYADTLKKNRPRPKPTRPPKTPTINASRGIGARTRASIYDRDAGVCQICFKRVHMKRKWPHSMSPSIDHIVPVCDGGTSEPTNLQLAHFRCNSLRRHTPLIEARQANGLLL